MDTLFLIKLGELTLKGGNRPSFERTLKDNILRPLEGTGASLEIRRDRFYLRVPAGHAEEAKQVLSKTYGLSGIAETRQVEKSIDRMREAAIALGEEILARGAGTSFKVESRRTDKSFPLDSYGISRELGAALLERFPQLTVSMERPDWVLHVEVREHAYLYGPQEKGAGGLPVGCAGRGVLLLSGGIDSPVAGVLMAKRGLRMDGVYFHAYPYTSDKAKEKVIRLAQIISPRVGGMRLWIVPFTEAQLAMKQGGKVDELTLIMRAAMMRIAHRIAERRRGVALITGESLSQVASQTPQSLRFTGSLTDLPVFRPLIGMDKEEIIRIARRIGTFETSILPYEDCCTIFAPKHPLVHPDFAMMQESWRTLELDALLEKSLDAAETIEV